MWQRLNTERGLLPIVRFLEIEKLQYTEIYGKLNYRNKIWVGSKVDDNRIENEANNSYLCGGNNKFNYLTIQSQPQSQPRR